MTYNGAAFPCQHKEGRKVCELSPNNSVHKRSTQYGFHEYVAPPEKVRVPTLEERVEALEQRVKELEELG